MTDDQHGEGTPRGGGRWDPLPQGDYDDGATAFVKLPEGGIDALLAGADSPLAAPGHGYVPPQITVAPATAAGTDPAAPGTWPVPGAPVDGAQWHDPHAGHPQHGAGAVPQQHAGGAAHPAHGGDAAHHQQGPDAVHYEHGPDAAHHEHGRRDDPHAGAQQHTAHDQFAYDPGVTGQWGFQEATAAETAAPAPGHDVTGQWSIPVAGGDLPDESGEFTTSALVEQWGGTPPATLPGGAAAPWAPQAPGQPWEQGAPAGHEQAGAGPAHERTGAPGYASPQAAGGHAPEQVGDGPHTVEHAPGPSGAAGRGHEARTHDGQAPDGSAHEDRAPDGSGHEDRAPDGSGQESYAHQGQAYDGRAHGEPGRGGPEQAAGHAPQPPAEPYAQDAAGHAAPQPPEEGAPSAPEAPQPASGPDEAPEDAPGAAEAAEGPAEPAADAVRSPEAPEAGHGPEAADGPATAAASGGPDAPGQDAPGQDDPGQDDPSSATAHEQAAHEPEPHEQAAHEQAAHEQAAHEQAAHEPEPHGRTLHEEAPAPDAPVPDAPVPDAPVPDAPQDAAHAPPGEEHPLASYVLRVNGTDRPVTDAWIGESLLYVLRERLGLAGAKDGCSQGECGACNVQVDGRLVASCLVPAVTAAGSEVRTVEGLAVDGQPSDVQRALARCGAVQCGFCVPGMAMTVHDLLEGNPAPTELETRQALCGNLCRCSGYRGVVRAVQEVVAEREAHTAGADEPEPDAGEPRIPHQAGPGAGGVHPAAFQPPGPHDQPYGQDGGQA
ncbi:2Fe-2S iron-sulfur cluster-binding protein [Streptomyces sp. NPDC052701]|uniref:2Fe-2S iron-sulfur cluster-binding protein n=1 Tax=Streptomyces sp. NPDC052701 TaxID=3155533 RepID=UPI00341C40F2